MTFERSLIQKSYKVYTNNLTKVKFLAKKRYYEDELNKSAPDPEKACVFIIKSFLSTK